MKTRLTRGTTNRVFHRLFSKQKRKDYVWAMNLKPGDGINSYDSWNHIVKSIKIIWQTVSPKMKILKDNRVSFGRCPGGVFVLDVDIFTTDGWLHSISETGCIEPAWPIEQIRNYFDGGVSGSVVDKMIEFGIIDKNGYRLRSATEEENAFIESFYSKSKTHKRK